MSVPIMRVKLLHKNAKVPFYATDSAAGADVSAVVDDGYDAIRILPGQRALIATGIAISVPSGWQVEVRSRSGLAFKNGIVVLNAPGTIDSDYRGEVGVILYNTSNEPFFVNQGDRIAQLVVMPAPQAMIAKVDELGETERGEGGYGSTGVQ